MSDIVSSNAGKPDELESVPDFPVLLIHIEYPVGSGLTACSGHPFRRLDYDEYPGVPSVVCTGCYNAARGWHPVGRCPEMTENQ